MKKTALILVAAVALSSTVASAQTSLPVTSRSVETPNILLFQPGHLLNGVVSIEYERALASFLGLQLGFSVTTFRGAFLPASQSSVIAVGPEIGVRFHFIKDAPGGLWIGPSVTGVYIAQRQGGAVARAFGYGLTAAIGYNFILGKHFALQLGVGGGFNDYGEGLAWAPNFRLGLGGAF